MSRFIALALLLSLASGCANTPKTPPNTAFYTSGQFDQEKAKDAYIAMLKARGYPMDEGFRKKLWVSDFGLGRFTEAGLGVVIWVSDQKNNYAGLDAFLLPGQIIPEHWHVKLKDVPEKMESWLVRYGTIYAYGEGQPTPAIKASLSQAEAPFLTVRHEKVLQQGDVAGISRAMEKHWMQAGPQGAVFSEFSTFHTGEAVRFTNPKIKF